MGEHTPMVGLTPMPAVARILSRFDRQHLESFMEVAVSLLDALDPDPDLELNGDELDGNRAEDEAGHYFGGEGPGCPLCDDDTAVDDNGCDDINDDREPEEPFHPSYGIDQSHAEPWHSSTERALMKPHRDRIRRTRCTKLTYGSTNGGHVFTEWRLR